MTAPIASGGSESPGGPCTHWKAPPCHGAHPLRSFDRVLLDHFPAPATDRTPTRSRRQHWLAGRHLLARGGLSQCHHNPAHCPVLFMPTTFVELLRKRGWRQKCF